MSKARELAALGNAYSDGALSNRNLIINGSMQVAQRGTSVSAAATQFLLDRFQWQTSAGPTVTLEQSTDAPSGFNNSLKVTVTTTDTMDAADYDAIYHPIEGLNASHLNFGTSNAQQFTLSFWAKASVIGTYAVNFINSDNSRTWTSSYSITSANTWEYKTITVDGDTSGTWLKTNGIGIKVWFSLGSGSNYNPASPSTAWTSGLNLGLDGTVDLRTTNGATWQITGVQLEVGDTATPFEHRSYGQELALCQRYFNRYSTQNGFTLLVPSINGGTTNARCGVALSTKLRATPTVTPSASNAIVIRNHGSFSNYGSTSIALGSEQQIEPNLIALSVSVASGLVAASINIPYINTGHYLDFDAEL